MQLSNGTQARQQLWEPRLAGGIEPFLRNLEVNVLKVSGWHTFLDAQDLDADYLIIGIVIEDDTGLHFGGLDDLRIVQAQVERVGFRVVVHFHS